MQRKWWVIGLLAAGLVGTEVALETWWLPSHWRTYDAAAPSPPRVADDDRGISLDLSWTCEQRPELLVREAPDRVTVLVRHHRFKGPDYQCPPDSFGSARLTARLASPLASRPLVTADG
ncbi:hypothetical protein [Kitasatospora sp. NPDC101183]|uniref:hypothetical protein n=1 Tax=Kitasatospora sp. NPDC101183 TaxID=3364100 RepID=UPI00381DF454